MHARTARLVLRPFTPGDADALLAYLGDPDVVRFEPYGPMARDEAVTEVARREQDPRFIAVERIEDGRLIGHVYRSPIAQPMWRTWTIGYVFHPQFGGQGYATEATRAVIDDCFRVEDAHRVTARCDPRNERSWRLLDRVGMRREGHERQCASFVDGPDGQPVWHDAYLYGVLAQEWPAQQNGAAPPQRNGPVD